MVSSSKSSFRYKSISIGIIYIIVKKTIRFIVFDRFNNVIELI